MIFLGIFELVMVIVLRKRYDSTPFSSEPLGKEKPGVLFFGVLSAATISLALVPQYYEIYVHKEVKGVSKTFMAVDCLGGE